MSRSLPCFHQIVGGARMELNDLLAKAGIEQATCLVLRHCPQSLELRRQLPWLAAERPDVFNCYQQTQSPKCEGQMRRAKHVASFIGHEPGKAVFVGLYQMQQVRELNHKQYLAIPAVNEERRITGVTSAPEKKLITWFDLDITDFYADWKGRMIIRWPPPEISWNRWAISNQFDIDTIHRESIFAQSIPDWRELILTWDDLRAIPSAWREALGQWRGIYYILDTKSGKGYVGSAYGAENLLGRWLNYAKTGHGGNRWLRSCEPQSLRFSILERMSPDTPPEEIIPRESSWKERLHTREFGLNGN